MKKGHPIKWTALFSCQEFFSKSMVSLLPKACRAIALSVTRRLESLDLEKEIRPTQIFR